MPPVETEREDWEYGDPCPECGHSGHFAETCAAHGVSHFDDEGNVIDFDWNLFDYPLYVECPECNTILMDNLPKENTVEVPIDVLESLRDHADYSHGKLSKTFDWEDPTQRMAHIRDQLDTALSGGDEFEEYEFEW